MRFGIIAASLLVGNVLAFQPSFSNRNGQRSTTTELNLAPSNNDFATRRQWAKDTVVATSGLGFITMPRNAIASDAIDTKASSTQPVLCDPSVSTFRNPSNNRVVHILGTAHISSASADVAGDLVRSIKPSAVFVELDAKRVGRAIPKPENPDRSETGAEDNSSQSFSASSSSVIIAPTPTNTQTGAQSTTQQNMNSSTPQKTTNPFNLKEKVLNKASQAVGNSIKGLYKKLESDGFDAGQEFVVAVKEGLNVGSKIILGDQDVEITLRRLTEALAKTDIKKLLAADSEMEENMKQMMPDNGSSTNTSGEMSKDEFKYFVETIKAKENVKMLMTNLKSVAPEIYMAMVGERDLYMANGLDKLNSFDSIVAVMGIAHVDGVETILKARGWEEVKNVCT